MRNESMKTISAVIYVMQLEMHKRIWHCDEQDSRNSHRRWIYLYADENEFAGDQKFRIMKNGKKNEFNCMLTLHR